MQAEKPRLPNNVIICYHATMATHPVTTHATTPPSRSMPLLAGMTAGVFVTLAAQVLLNNHDMHIGTIWQNIAGGDPLNARAALVWWVIAGSALVVGAAVAGLLARFPQPWKRYRALRWILSALALLIMADVAGESTVPEGIGPLAQLGATAGAIFLAALMAGFGAIFALRK